MEKKRETEPPDPSGRPAVSGDDAGGEPQTEPGGPLLQPHGDDYEYGGSLQPPQDQVRVELTGETDGRGGRGSLKLWVPHDLGPLALVLLGILASALIWAKLSAPAGFVAMVVIVAFSSWTIVRRSKK